MEACRVAVRAYVREMPAIPMAMPSMGVSGAVGTGAREKRV